jgi:GDP-L-fucose synthase
MQKNSSIYIAGHRGMVGSALVRSLQSKGYDNLITRTHAELDLTNQKEVNAFFAGEQIDCVILAAAKVGGIHANNTYRADFIYENLMIEANVIHAAFKAGIQHLLFLGSSCIYPKQCPQPMKEEHLLSGYLEPTNEPYAIAKIAGINLCDSYNRQYGTQYRAVMPTNLYGPNDNFDLQNSHVLPAMIRKFHLAKLALNKDIEAIRKDEALSGPIPDDIKAAIGLQNASGLSPNKIPSVILWGTGVSKREFLHVDDMAEACVHVMTMPYDRYVEVCQATADFIDHGIESVSHINVGYGSEVTIRQLSEIIENIVGFDGGIVWDSTMPDGMTRKLMDTTRLTQAGWTRRIELVEGIRYAYQWYLAQGV